MPRYFLEISYKGTNYSGFQVQKNAKTVQSEIELALQVLYRQHFNLTGSSRTDAGVHALQNFFHFDTDIHLTQKEVYNLNAILPPDIAAKAFYIVSNDAHSRFGAVAREYRYYIYDKKNPLLTDRAWYYPFSINHEILQQTAGIIKEHNDFKSFSKQNTQVNNYNCNIIHSYWQQQPDCIIYNVKANRFLRGMVRALVSSMLKTARGNATLQQFNSLLNNPQQSSADFSAPAHGLFLVSVQYPLHYMRLID